MEVIEQLQEDLRTGRIDANRLVDLIGTLQRELRAAKQRNTELEQRVADLEKQLAGTPGPAKVDEPFSMRAEEKRQEARGKKRRKRKGKGPGRRGRLCTADKVGQAERTEEAYPDGVPRAIVGCPTRGRCGVWTTAVPCWSPTALSAARTTSTARSPASWDAAPSQWCTE